MSDAPGLELGPPPPRIPACQAMPPEWFDATDPDGAADALSCCAVCTVHSWCSALVRPRTSRYDGVAAGRIFKNGKDVGGLEHLAATA